MCFECHYLVFKSQERQQQLNCCAGNNLSSCFCCTEKDQGCKWLPHQIRIYACLLWRQHDIWATTHAISSIFHSTGDVHLTDDSIAGSKEEDSSPWYYRNVMRRKRRVEKEAGNIEGGGELIFNLLWCKFCRWKVSAQGWWWPRNSPETKSKQIIYELMMQKDELRISTTLLPNV